MWGECENKKAPQIEPVTHRSCRKQVNTTEAPVAATGKQCYNYFNTASTMGRLVKCNTLVESTINKTCKQKEIRVIK